MKRRDFIGTAVVATTSLAFASALGEQSRSKTATKPNPLVIPNADQELAQFAEALSNCWLKGEACARHCDDQLANGETEFANCSTAVRQMNVICEATAKLAILKSVRLKEVTETCINACKACKDACEEHKAHWVHGMHLECKECAEHCDKTLAAAQKLKKKLG